MRKLFPLELPNHAPPRVVEGIKSDVRKYMKRTIGRPYADAANEAGDDVAPLEFEELQRV